MNDYIPGHIPAVITLSVIVGILLIGFILLMVYIKKIKPKLNKDINVTLTPEPTPTINNQQPVNPEIEAKDINDIINQVPPTSEPQQPTNPEIKKNNINIDNPTVTVSPTDSNPEPTNPEAKEGDNNNNNTL